MYGVRKDGKITVFLSCDMDFEILFEKIIESKLIVRTS